MTNLKGGAPRMLYVYEFYCDRGQSENMNMIKNLKNALKGDRLSCSDFLANAVRLLLHAVTYLPPLPDPRKACPKHLRFTREVWQFGTIRLRLIKVAGLFIEQARRIILHLPASFPNADLWAKISAELSTRSVLT